MTTAISAPPSSSNPRREPGLPPAVAALAPAPAPILIPTPAPVVGRVPGEGAYPDDGRRSRPARHAGECVQAPAGSATAS